LVLADVVVRVVPCELVTLLMMMPLCCFGQAVILPQDLR
jgi:hypothetical protein